MTLIPDHSLAGTLSQLQQGYQQPNTHAPRILVLYGSVRAESNSRKLALNAAQMLEQFGAEVRVFDPDGLPVCDRVSIEHPKVVELRDLAQWSEGMVWCSPEIHGAVSSVFKNQIDWIPLSEGSIRPTQGKTLAVMQVNGGSQSFNVVNALRVLGRWMRMFTIPNQSSVPKAFQEFDANGQMKDSPYRDRVVDVMEELFRMTLLLRNQAALLTHRFSENKSDYQARVEAAAAVEPPVAQRPCCA